MEFSLNMSAYGLLMGTPTTLSLGKTYLYGKLYSLKPQFQSLRTPPIHSSSKFYKKGFLNYRNEL